MKLPDALQFVKERRSIASPNDGFLKQLREYEMSLFGNSENFFFDPAAEDYREDEDYFE